MDRSYVLDDVVLPFTSRIYSHRSSWARMQGCMLLDYGYDVELAFGDDEKIRHSDHWIISHGMEFKGTYNLNGGFTQKIADRLRLLAAKSDSDMVSSLEIPMPDLVGLLYPRAKGTKFDLEPWIWEEVDYVCNNADVITLKSLLPSIPKRVVLGDSHSVARYETETLVLRNDGLTLHGLLSRGVENMLTEAGINVCGHLVISAGNIDIRHHLARLPDPQKSISEMLVELARQLRDLWERGKISSFEVTAPYPIEFEERKLPKTGYYKGTPFYGTWAQRNALRAYMETLMKLTFAEVFTWPVEWYTMDPEKYADTFMEKPRSVHLSPAFYPWDMERNERRG